MGSASNNFNTKTTQYIHFYIKILYLMAFESYRNSHHLHIFRLSCNELMEVHSPLVLLALRRISARPAHILYVHRNLRLICPLNRICKCIVVFDSFRLKDYYD